MVAELHTLTSGAAADIMRLSPRCMPAHIRGPYEQNRIKNILDPYRSAISAPNNLASLAAFLQRNTVTNASRPAPVLCHLTYGALQRQSRNLPALFGRLNNTDEASSSFRTLVLMLCSSMVFSNNHQHNEAEHQALSVYMEMIYHACSTFGNFTQAILQLSQNQERVNFVSDSLQQQQTTTNFVALQPSRNTTTISLLHLYQNTTSAYATLLFGPAETRKPHVDIKTCSPPNHHPAVPLDRCPNHHATLRLGMHIPISNELIQQLRANGVLTPEEYVYVASRHSPSLGLFVDRSVFQRLVAPVIETIAAATILNPAVPRPAYARIRAVRHRTNIATVCCPNLEVLLAYLDQIVSATCDDDEEAAEWFDQISRLASTTPEAPQDQLPQLFINPLSPGLASLLTPAVARDTIGHWFGTIAEPRGIDMQPEYNAAHKQRRLEQMGPERAAAVLLSSSDTAASLTLPRDCVLVDVHLL